MQKALQHFKALWMCLPVESDGISMISIQTDGMAGYTMDIG